MRRCCCVESVRCEGEGKDCHVPFCELPTSPLVYSVADVPSRRSQQHPSSPHVSSVSQPDLHLQEELRPPPALTLGSAAVPVSPVLLHSLTQGTSHISSLPSTPQHCLHHTSYSTPRFLLIVPLITSFTFYTQNFHCSVYCTVLYSLVTFIYSLFCLDILFFFNSMNELSIFIYYILYTGFYIEVDS